MTAKQFLQRAYRLDAIIASDLREVESLRGCASSVSPQLSAAPGGTGSSGSASFESVINKMIDLEKEINSEIDELLEAKKSVRELIMLVPDSDTQLCLRLRYLDFKGWESVADELHYSVRQVLRLHKSGLDYIDLHGLIEKVVTKCH